MLRQGTEALFPKVMVGHKQIGLVWVWPTACCHTNGRAMARMITYFCTRSSDFHGQRGLRVGARGARDACGTSGAGHEQRRDTSGDQSDPSGTLPPDYFDAFQPESCFFDFT
jgi:hypothetical protein